MAEQGVVDGREGGPGRPELTPERIRWLLELLPRGYERETGIGKFLFRPALRDECGMSASGLTVTAPAPAPAD